MPAYYPPFVRALLPVDESDSSNGGVSEYEPVMIMSDHVLSNDGDVMMAKGLPDVA